MRYFRVTFVEVCHYEMYLGAPDEQTAVARARNSFEYGELVSGGFDRFEAEELSSSADCCPSQAAIARNASRST